MDKSQLEKIHLNTWMRFSSNMGALYSFFEKVTETADEFDKDKIKKLATDLAILLKDDPIAVEEDLSRYFPSIDNLDVYPDIRKDDSVREMMTAFQESDFISKVLDWEKRHPYKSQKFLKIIYSAFNDPPIMGITLRKSMLITLVTFFEMLLGDLFTNYSLSRHETKEAAIELLNEMMNVGWGKRLTNLKKIGVDSKAQKKYTNEIIEITKRRNLLVHNDGVVDDKYLANAPQQYKDLTPGSILVVSTHYFQRAIDIVYSLGFLLCFISWQVNKIDKKVQHRKLDEFIIMLLNQKRYSLVLELTEAAKTIEISEEIRQRMLANRAIAFRELGKGKDVKKIITKLTQSEHDWQIDVAIFMLRQDYASLKSQLEYARETYGNINKIFYWPLFDPVREEIWFKTIFRKRAKRNYDSSIK